MESQKKDILKYEDIVVLVDSFYNKIRQDDLLADIFKQIINDNWTTHLEKMYRFWQTVLLSEHTYYGSPFAPHANMPIKGLHFERWIQLFDKTVDENFLGEKAIEAKLRAGKMAKMFQIKIAYYKTKLAKPLI